MKILIVSDNLLRSQQIKNAVKKHYTVDICGSTEEAISKAKMVEYLVIVADFYEDDQQKAAHISNAIRKSGITTAVLAVLPAEWVKGRIKLLDAGVDYFLMRPFYPPELFARINAISRRDHSYFNVTHKLKFGTLVIDIPGRVVAIKNEKIELTRKEFDVLIYLAKNRGRTVSRDMILTNVWELDGGGWHNTVDVHIKHLRDKIDKPYETNRIRSVYGMGYIFK